MIKKNNLDEMQEQKLLKIEHNGCWLAFWGLLIVIVVQMVIGGGDFYRLAGEWIVFMVLCLYIAVDCARNGIWDRRLKSDGKTNLIISVIAAVVFGAVTFASTYLHYRKPAGSAAAAVISAVIVFIACFAALTIVARYTNKKQAALEAEPEDDGEDAPRDR